MNDYRDDDEPIPCSDCGEPIWGDAERVYTLGEAFALCWDCANRRGGLYDEDTERWIIAPELYGMGVMHDLS